MTLTLPGADLRGYLTVLGIHIPDRVNGPNVTVRCFANPAAHRTGDRTPSLALNITTGAWKTATAVTRKAASTTSRQRAATALGRRSI